MSSSKKSDGSLVAVPRAWLLALLLVVIVPWLIAGVLYFRTGGPVAEPEAAAPPAGGLLADPGPWGQLELTPIIVSPPIEYVAADWGRAEEGPDRWFFPETSAELLERFLASAGFTSEQVARLTAGAKPDPRIRGYVLFPEPDLVRGMSPDLRQRMYRQLSKTRLNFDQSESFRFRGASPDEWFKGSLISPATRSLVAPLVYRDADFLHFADVELVRSEIEDPRELQRLAKTLLRQSAMLIRLSVPDAQDVPELTEYWGRGGRRTDIRPLLESVAGGGATRAIDIVHLLPAFARNRLYRYPQLTTADLIKPLLVNCLWSSLNFFRAEPDDRFLDLNHSLAALRQDYYVVESGFQLGDIVAFVDAEGDLYHVAVYIADDLLFTKNGTSPMAPWTIMPLDWVKGYYRTHTEEPRLIYHRRKDL